MEATGSSPRMRGTGYLPPCRFVNVRFIPTCAGSRAGNPNRIPSMTVHPHVRGEQFIRPSLPSCTGGSSPRARGAESNHCRHPRWCRFLPTCAGSRGQGSRPVEPAPVHPHVRGEQVRTLDLGIKSPGSSPRARGAAKHRQHLAECPRFIPACAGSRLAGFNPAHNGSVHPRVRGEQPLNRISGFSCHGSSPRARGAGNASSVPAHRVPVHPRVRGEQAVVTVSARPIGGSSPRARGAGPMDD